MASHAFIVISSYFVDVSCFISYWYNDGMMIYFLLQPVAFYSYCLNYRKITTMYNFGHTRRGKESIATHALQWTPSGHRG